MAPLPSRNSPTLNPDTCSKSWTRYRIVSTAKRLWNDARREKERERSKRGRGGGRLEREKGYSRREDLVLWKGKKKSFEAYNNNLYAGHISRKAAVNYGSRGRRKWFRFNNDGLSAGPGQPLSVKRRGPLLLLSAMSPPARGHPPIESRLESRLVCILIWIRTNTFLCCVFNYAEIRFVLNDPPRFFIIHPWTNDSHKWNWLSTNRRKLRLPISTPALREN